jgi:Ferritin-like domain
LNQELFNHDLFQFILANFSEQEFEDAGMNPQYVFLIRFMANQEAGHAQLLQNILGGQLTALTDY